MHMALVQHWRKRNKLTQVEAAALLGVSQPYLSLLERGARPLTAELRSRLKTAHQMPEHHDNDNRFRSQFSALGYPGFAHVPQARRDFPPDVLLFAILCKPDADPRLVEALPWLIRRYASRLNLPWLVRQAKLHDLQNRLGFLLHVSAADDATFAAAIQELECARLLKEDTLCWNSMPIATRKWMRVKRSRAAAHWNILTTLQPGA